MTSDRFFQLSLPWYPVGKRVITAVLTIQSWGNMSCCIWITWNSNWNVTNSRLSPPPPSSPLLRIYKLVRSKGASVLPGWCLVNSWFFEVTSSCNWVLLLQLVRCSNRWPPPCRLLTLHREIWLTLGESMMKHFLLLKWHSSGFEHWLWLRRHYVNIPRLYLWATLTSQLESV